jgi:hypothetical protein
MKIPLFVLLLIAYKTNCYYDYSDVSSDDSSVKFIDMTDINTNKLIYIGKVRKDLHLNSLID